MTYIRIVTKPEQVLQNIQTFQEEVETNGKNNDLAHTLSHFRAWYAIKAGSEWIFGPSKFVGYSDLTANSYSVNNAKLDGRQTEATIQPWFTEVSSGPLHDELHEALNDFLASFGKKPSTLARISVRSDAFNGVAEEANSATNLAKAFLTIYRNLPTESQQEFRRYIKKEA